MNEYLKIGAQWAGAMLLAVVLAIGLIVSFDGIFDELSAINGCTPRPQIGPVGVSR